VKNTQNLPGVELVMYLDVLWQHRSPITIASSLLAQGGSSTILAQCQGITFKSTEHHLQSTASSNELPRTS